ncbi:GAF and ANTAR domain-containing protein [Paenarthrobacter sp. GOM3]|nr:GAF and ANTAR domain-containing protein [Paenarthrobacter sp. GOM3]WOH20627.1 GAF and ANTAR domain-containing protein [Paenarthrobacter sp. GOM3]
METEDQNADFQRLHQLIAGTEDVKGFVDGMTRYAATTLSRVTGARIECAVTLWRRKRAATLAGSSDDAILLDGIEQSLGAGPVLEAVETSQPVLLADTQTDERWPKYSNNVAAAGARSVLGVPLALGNDASAALNFFAPATGLFNQAAIAEATQFADMAAQALRLALRIASADLLAEDLRAAMERRTAIDIATGIVMTESRCSQDEAFEFLIRASQNRNQKVHDLAEGIVAGRSGATGKTTTHFQD